MSKTKCKDLLVHECAHLSVSIMLILEPRAEVQESLSLSAGHEQPCSSESSRHK